MQHRACVHAAQAVLLHAVPSCTECAFVRTTNLCVYALYCTIACMIATCTHAVSDKVVVVQCSWEDSEDLAVSANAFMRSQLHAAYRVPKVPMS